MIGKRPQLLNAWPKFLEKFKLAAANQIGAPLDAVEERVAAQFALFALAGELATKSELTGWTPLTSRSAAIELFQLWKQGRVNPLSKSEILRRIKIYVDANMSRLQVIGGEPIADPIGWMDDTRIMFGEEAWTEMHGDSKPRTVAKLARSHGILIAADGDNLKAKSPSGVPGRPRLYIVNRSALEQP